MYAPTGKERTLYVFGCNKLACSGKQEAWQVVRVLGEERVVEEVVEEVQDEVVQEQQEVVQQEVQEVQQQQPVAAPSSGGDGGGLASELERLLNLRDASLGVTTGFDIAPAAAANPPSNPTKKKKKRKRKKKGKKQGQGEQQQQQQQEQQEQQEPQQPQPQQAQEQPQQPTHGHPAFTPFYLLPAREPGPKPKAQQALHERHMQAIADFEAQLAASSAASDDSGEWQEAFEEYGDVAFDKFNERVAREPNQCVRYAYGSAPLWATSSSRVRSADVPACEACGAERRFELQLMPRLLIDLQVDEVAATPGQGMDWATVVVFVCSADCGASESCHEELCFIQRVQ